MYVEPGPENLHDQTEIRRLPFFPLLTCISSTLDLINPAVAHHHMRVANITNALGRELGLAEDVLNDLIVAAAVHDIGGFSSRERIDLMQFELNSPHRHARVGHALLQTFPPFARGAEFVRFHHVPWDEGNGLQFDGQDAPIESHLLHLADRVSVLLRPTECILAQADKVREKIKSWCPREFAPDLCEAFYALCPKDFFWMDAASPFAGEVLGRSVRLPDLHLDLDGLWDLANLFRKLIDFRSPYTARHTSGVAAVACAIAELAGFKGTDLRLMEIAGFFHDLGKLAIPLEILEKPARLEPLEYDVMRSHAWHTYRILEAMPGLETVCMWGALHQEYLDGSGYPFGLKLDRLPLGSRVLAVADVFTALAEDRPYRAALPPDTVMRILGSLGQAEKLDAEIISLLDRNVDFVNERRIEAQAQSETEYEQFVEKTG